MLKADLRQRAVSLYRAGGDTGGLEALNADNAVQAARRARLGDIAARTTQRASQKLEDTRTELGKVQDTLRAEESDLRQQKASLDDQVGQQERLQTVMAQKVDAANAALARARALGALRAAGDPVMGPSLLTADQLVRWYNAQSYRPRLETSIDDLARIFIEEGNDEGVRGDFAFAQSIVETAGFNAAPANNYSGIGWCDSCATGNRFPNPREGVRAQIQLLVNYADGNALRRQPPPPGVAVSLRLRPRRRGAQVRQLLRERLGTHLARHGPRQLGHRTELRRSGDRRLQPHEGLLAGRLGPHVGRGTAMRLRRPG